MVNPFKSDRAFMASLVVILSLLIQSSVAVAQVEDDPTEEPPSEEAPAQPRNIAPPVGLAEAFQPDFLRRDAQLLIEFFKLDDTQQAVFEALYNDYEKQFQEGTTAMREEIGRLQPTPQEDEALRRQHHESINRQMEILVDQIMELQQDDSPEAVERKIALQQKLTKLRDEQVQVGGAAAVDVDVMREVMAKFDAVITKWEQQKSALYTDLVESTKTVMSEGQRNQWPSFERMLRRVKLLPQGHLSGEQIDLLALVKQLSITADQRATIAGVLESYEIALDDALRSREDFLRSTRKQRAEVLAHGNIEGARSLMNQELDRRIAIRTVNEDYARSIADSLGGEAGATLNDTFMKSAYAKAFRKTWGERSFDAMLQANDLSDSQRGDIETLAATNRSQIAAQREQFIALMRQHEPKQLSDRFVAQVERVSGKEQSWYGDNPLIDAYTRMREQQDLLVDQGVALLSEEQKAELPGFVFASDEPQQANAQRGPGDVPPTGYQLTPEQRRALYRQYDTNQDGDLSPEERVELDRELERRVQEERERRRKESGSPQ